MKTHDATTLVKLGRSRAGQRGKATACYLDSTLWVFSYVYTCTGRILEGFMVAWPEEAVGNMRNSERCRSNGASRKKSQRLLPCVFRLTRAF